MRSIKDQMTEIRRRNGTDPDPGIPEAANGRIRFFAYSPTA